MVLMAAEGDKVAAFNLRYLANCRHALYTSTAHRTASGIFNKRNASTFAEYEEMRRAGLRRAPYDGTRRDPRHVPPAEERAAQELIDELRERFQALPNESNPLRDRQNVRDAALANVLADLAVGKWFLIHSFLLSHVTNHDRNRKRPEG